MALILTREDLGLLDAALDYYRSSFGAAAVRERVGSLRDKIIAFRANPDAKTPCAAMACVWGRGHDNPNHMDADGLLFTYSKYGEKVLINDV